MSGNNIKVVCRFRPQNSLEIREGGVPIVEITDGVAVQLKGREAQDSFAFDKVFGMETEQQEIFEYSIKSIVDDVVAGYNGTVFAYGQTGSGKTFTMMGSDIDDERSKGIIPRIVEQIFQSIMMAPANMEFTVKVSYMEIYMEKVRDLLNPSQDNLPIHEDKAKGVYVKGLLEVYVASTEEVFEVMRRGGNARVVAYTNMNAESSRSHSIVQITITQKNLDTGAAKSGKLYLVDLAGSEKVGKTGASGQTLEEAKKINKSLTALGMVINNLTDGKSSHIPYRDSKLTRILQESLGGNSRTTLIINCSPSSYNEQETIGTLRFGIRAKTIKNKAKVNADLSPAELKALLKKVKSEAVTYQQYITALEGEVIIWRQGGQVPESSWATMEKATKGNLPQVASPQQTTATAFKPLVEDSRPATPALVLEKDEREEFLRRENELMDQIAEKETELANGEKLVETITEELTFLKDQEKNLTAENQAMSTELSDVKLQLQKIEYESKESAINVESLKETNQDLHTELEELKKSLEAVRSAQKVNVDEEKMKRKADKMAEMMAGFDPSGEISEKEKQIRDALYKFDLEKSNGPMTMEDIAQLRQELAESKSMLEAHENLIKTLNEDKEGLETKRSDLETRLTTLEMEYEELLDKTIAEEEEAFNRNTDIAETISELKVKLEHQYAAKKELQHKEIEELKKEVERKNEEYQKLSSAMSDLKRANEDLQSAIASKPSSTGNMSEKEKDLERMRKSMAQQLADFEVMKKALMRDLQNRCEKVVELEISLDETREQYNNALRASNNKAQQKKMAFLERNLEQLTNVQKQLVEQNSSLKKEVALAEPKPKVRSSASSGS
ncbi:hypothetical protein K450DRAFT_221443 [Umbelopsis ramanniana AG]|uniref:Kinesin-like protein n=1 Tax=Umbelopsis ramanniana AG TaxID=1314678 RepID=A0AAD5HHX8_UMBRA|nr:uncharacterized protein K450DRAFT_221443 [Umbelopsis ramanniana AG]KAI8583484.1 hypothetical protein K450DRAFT_221443 [Umbelopsis ramanniana AG]